jgi:phage gp46-like protein
MPFDIALRYDPERRRFDAAIERGDGAVDRTLATPMVVAMFSDRRARPDDALPLAGTFLTPSTMNPRRGWPGDALDGEGRRLGSLLWLLDREKQTEQTRLRAIAYVRDALAGIAERGGLSTSVEAAWLRRGVLAVAARLGAQQVRLSIAARGPAGRSA